MYVDKYILYDKYVLYDYINHIMCLFFKYNVYSYKLYNVNWLFLDLVSNGKWEQKNT